MFAECSAAEADMFDRNDFISMFDDEKTRRKQFSANSGIQKNKKSPTFSVPFDNGLVRHFLYGTGKVLKYNPSYDQHYCFLRSDEDIALVEEWERNQGSRVFLRNLLDSTVALDTNFVDNQSGGKTECGLLEEQAKHHGHSSAIDQLASRLADTIGDISYLRRAPFVMAVPATADKAFDLPRELARRVAKLTDKVDLTPTVEMTKKTGSAKDLSRDKKWDLWAQTEIDFTDGSFLGSEVVVLDDKYQSGATMHFIASQLYGYGAKKVHGLVGVKTLRDSDNLNVDAA